MQEQVGVREPVFGWLLDSGHRRSGEDLRLSELVSPAIENELCVTLGVDLVGPGVTAERARDAIATIAPAFEVIERRGVFSEIALSVADNIQQRAFVTGTAVAFDPDVLDLSAVELALEIDGVHQERAYGREVMGSPVNSVAWLANKLAEFGLGLSAGQRVMSGSFTRQYPISGPALVSATFAPLGTVTARFV
jgi:2-keto-4-pentenoate hydratase